MCNDAMAEYWDRQAAGFTAVSLYELDSDARNIWHGVLSAQLPANAHNILDVGCGAGFFGVLLSSEDRNITELDRSANMLHEAEKNIEKRGKPEFACYVQSDAQRLPFPDGSFDAVISRNVMWALTEPALVYEEWLRVLKPGGILLNFDANWFLYITDRKAMTMYEKGLQLVRQAGFTPRDSGHDPFVDSAIDALELTSCRRPEWDVSCLGTLNCRDVSVIPALPSEIFDEYYRLQYRYIPTFAVRVRKDF